MKLLRLLFALFPLSLMAQTSYFLHPVTKVEDGYYYVFVQEGMAVKASMIDGNSLDNERNFDMDNAQKDELHVWRYRSQKLYNDHQKAYLCNKISSGNVTTKFSWDTSSDNATNWRMEFNGDSCRIVVDNPGNKNDGRNVARDEKNHFKAYAAQSYPNKFRVYKLVTRLEDHVTHTITDSLATICLPRDVASWEGCEVYQVDYIEETSMTLSPIKGNMIAGHSYVVRATADRQVFHYTGDAYVTVSTSTEGLIGNLSSSPKDVSNLGRILYRNAWRPAQENVRINPNHSHFLKQ